MEKKFEELESWQRELLIEAESVMKNAYNLYSHFYVGAALLTDDGEVFLGTNAENSSSGATVCAERTAVLSANTKGKRNYKAVAVIGSGEDFECEQPVTPCGICRQVLNDFSQIANKDITLICSNTRKNKILITTIKELFPHSFSPKDTGQDLTRFR